MQDSWGNGEDMGHWDAEDGDMWNSPTSQESSSSCNSWGNGPKKIPNKVRKHALTLDGDRPRWWKSVSFENIVHFDCAFTE